MSEPLIVEDLLLVLFDPASGTIAGENTLFYVLGGAVLTDLAFDERITTDEGGRRVSAAGDPPVDALLRPAWERIAEKPRDVQTILAMVGPTLRPLVIDRLVERGHLRTERKKVLGLVPATLLRDGGTPRRAALIQELRAVLAEGSVPSPRIAAIGALVSASGTLPTFHREIPWSGEVHNRGKDLERGEWGAGAAGEAVARTVAATVTNSMIAAGVIPPS